MTREEAIKVLNTYDVNFNEYTAEEIADAIDMAIEALSADTSSDLINRADALRELNGTCSNWEDDAKVAEIINELPSADAVHIHNDGTLEVKVPNAQKVGRVLVMDADSHIGGGLFYPDDAVQGEWVCKEREYNDCDGHYAYYWYECSVCGARPPKDTWKNEWHSNYCPSCGARMYKGGDDE